MTNETNKKKKKIDSDNLSLFERVAGEGVPEKYKDRIREAVESREWKFNLLQKFSPWHHSAAQMIAAGMKISTIAEKLGRTKQHLYKLRTVEPAFNELVNLYRELQTESSIDLRDQLEGLSTLAAKELLDRLMANPDKFSNKELFELLRLSADRTGHGPTSKVEGEFSAHGVAKVMLERLDKVRAEITKEEEDDTLVLEAEEVKELPSP